MSMQLLWRTRAGSKYPSAALQLGTGVTNARVGPISNRKFDLNKGISLCSGTVWWLVYNHSIDVIREWLSELHKLFRICTRPTFVAVLVYIPWK
jgi:hypothetical protein